METDKLPIILFVLILYLANTLILGLFFFAVKAIHEITDKSEGLSFFSTIFLGIIFATFDYIVVSWIYTIPH